MINKVFFHIDVNSAYLSWEAARRLRSDKKALDIRKVASVISGNPDKRSGIVLAKSEVAKIFGIKTGESIKTAREKCPNIYVIAADFDLYIESSKKLMQLLRTYSPNVYQYSIDEAFIDMTGTGRLFGDPVICADNMRKKVYEELGFTINIGISENMVLAKMAGDFSKPNKTHTLFKNEIEKKLWPLPIEDLFFVGRKTSKKLRNIGITNIGELANMNISVLRKYFNKHGEIIYNHANGLDGYDFLKKGSKEKSIGNSTTTAFDIEDRKTAKHLILSLAETVCARLRHKDMKAKVVSLEFLNTDFKRYSMQKKMEFGTNSITIIYECACSIFDNLWDGRPIRHIGVSTSKIFDKQIDQINFLDIISNEKLNQKELKLYSAIDSIRDKYGTESIQRASFVNGSFKHMEGGTSKNKKDGLVYL
ncbi:DNA polymerase Y family protein [Peptostreptococcus equinus]|uniref:DNA-directed DNA polymerase n=1 Tax=Peptostreptococcus equinus TaxID=3003601 RepID=A0ABY7JSX1_9FIRM|nr:DNA polymerase IV [Peptostreptococcus sp. CBA3647]WAW15153.1 DNA polymerase IV [Peptostreptococcus sp. CBA3647]